MPVLLLRWNDSCGEETGRSGWRSGTNRTHDVRDAMMIRLPSTVAAVTASAVSTTVATASAAATATTTSAAASTSVAASSTTSGVLCHLGELMRYILLGVCQDLDEVSSDLGLAGCRCGESGETSMSAGRVADTMEVRTSHESEGRARPARSTSSSDSVNVVFDTVGHVVIQNIAVQETGNVSDV